MPEVCGAAVVPLNCQRREAVPSRSEAFAPIANSCGVDAAGDGAETFGQRDSNRVPVTYVVFSGSLLYALQELPKYHGAILIIYS